MTTISIVMPVKNTASFLDECMQSIVNQSFSKWQLVVVNDHSEDGSFDILKKWSMEDARVVVLENEGSGITPALQTALKHAKGDFVTRMDSDDIMHHNKIELLLDACIEGGYNSIGVGGVKYFSKQPLGNGYLRYESWLNGLLRTSGHFKEIYKECVVPSPCWMMAMDDFKALGGFNSDSYPEDYDLCFRMYRHGATVVSVPEEVHFWRDYQERTSRNDPHYKDNYFLPMKIKYFLEVDYVPALPLVLWGAGKKGKTLAQFLIQAGVPFHWVCNNQNKIGKEIYGQIMQNQLEIGGMRNAQIIVAVVAEEDQKQIQSIIQEMERPKVHYFC